jgi:hypothetical protein
MASQLQPSVIFGQSGGVSLRMPEQGQTESSRTAATLAVASRADLETRSQEQLESSRRSHAGDWRAKAKSQTEAKRSIAEQTVDPSVSS